MIFSIIHGSEKVDASANLLYVIVQSYGAVCKRKVALAYDACRID